MKVAEIPALWEQCLCYTPESVHLEPSLGKMSSSPWLLFSVAYLKFTN